MTITDLQWNPKYAGDIDLVYRINTTFQKFIKYLYERKIGFLFIPQLFGKENDYTYMHSFLEKNCYILPVKEEYDCYFQQYVIENLDYVVGMRYHSNIFSAKMGISFISIAYEQKMSGFMENAELSEYCIDINELSEEILRNKFEKVERDYIQYKRILKEKIPIWKQESYTSTELVDKILVERNLV